MSKNKIEVNINYAIQFVSEVKDFILLGNEHAMCCPFRQPTPSQSKVTGEVVFTEKPCGSWCPLLEVKGSKIVLNCSGEPTYISPTGVYEFNTKK